MVELSCCAVVVVKEVNDRMQTMHNFLIIDFRGNQIFIGSCFVLFREEKNRNMLPANSKSWLR